MVVNILIVSNSGVESLIDFNPDDDLNTLVKSYRTPQNKMVCILQDGKRTHRWDRSYGSVQKNHWRKVAPDSFEILGSIENIRHAREI
ncbi:pilus assembly protein PilI [Salmonella enterica]|nr:pilus assembly protein PilI [Salmonella enterica]ECF6081030.1 pilus assembly protein PilI [Salmonella enterica subsp. diarizonae]ECH1317749.1 pilus assembly protein PilI [Salmonella enterica subsp. enterica serovar Kottbus]ECN3840709.1 pilus assembly protein PilI [Salmonella enterica subsp. enterica serovar Newport]EDK6606803.1 pilus assembly protein PilI [Salmonella enterica subsp. enterica serovar Litchfield]EDX6465867.1 pilus assembly protein PilI [Salmonella enterica subsp. diarizonae s